MKKIHTVMTVAALAFACLMFASCPVELRFEQPIPRGEPWGDPPFNGPPRVGTAQGYRSPVLVRLYLTEGIIVDAYVDPSGESPTYWELFPVVARHRIIANNGMNFTLDGLGGATTARAIIQAGRNALLTIPGVTEDDL